MTWPICSVIRSYAAARARTARASSGPAALGGFIDGMPPPGEVTRGRTQSILTGCRGAATVYAVLAELEAQARVASLPRSRVGRPKKETTVTQALGTARKSLRQCFSMRQMAA